MINVALQTAHGLILADGAPVVDPPFIAYDPVSHLIAMYGPSEYISNAVDPVNIYMNNALNTNFNNSFPNNVQAGPPSPDGRDVQFLIADLKLNSKTIGGTLYYSMSQETVSIQLMLSFTSIVLMTGTIPIRNEWIGAGDRQTTNNFLPIMTDFNIQFATGLEIKNLITYLPTAQYRYTTLQSDIPITQIDLQLYWRSNFGDLYPIQISPYREGNVKILFEKK